MEIVFLLTLSRYNWNIVLSCIKHYNPNLPFLLTVTYFYLEVHAGHTDMSWCGRSK